MDEYIFLGVSSEARRVLSSLVPVLHPQSSSLHIPVLDEKEMRRIVAKVLDQEEEEVEEEDVEGEGERNLSTVKPSGMFGVKKPAQD